MKTAAKFLMALLLTGNSIGQGTLLFSTRHAQGPDAPVELNEVGGPGPGPSFSAGLWLVSNGDLIFLASSLTTFRDGTSNPLLAKYVVPVEVVVPVDPLPPFTPVTLRMRAWETSAGSFDAAQRRGESGDIVVSVLGKPPGGTPGELPTSFHGFVIPAIPEPSAFLLLLIGWAAMTVCRARNAMKSGTRGSSSLQ